MNFSALKLSELKQSPIDSTEKSFSLIDLGKLDKGSLNSQDTPFNKMMNERLYGRQEDTIRVNEQVKERREENPRQDDSKRTDQTRNQRADEKETNHRENKTVEKTHSEKNNVAQNKESKTTEVKEVSTEKESVKETEKKKSDKKSIIQDVIIRDVKLAQSNSKKAGIENTPRLTQLEREKGESESTKPDTKNHTPVEKEFNLKETKQLTPQAKELITAALKSKEEAELIQEKLGSLISKKLKNKAGQPKAKQTLEKAQIQGNQVHVSRETINEPKLNLAATQLQNKAGELTARESLGEMQGNKGQAGNESQNQNFSNLSQTNASRAASLAKNLDLPQLKAPLTQQFEAMMSKAKVVVRNSENARLTAQMYPRELGKVSLRLSLIDGSLHGKFFVENEQVQRELMSRLDQIADDMRADGFEVSEFSVDVQSNENQDARSEKFAQKSNQGNTLMANESYLSNQLADIEEGQYA